MKTNEAKTALKGMTLPPDLRVLQVTTGTEWQVFRNGPEGTLHQLAPPMPLGDAVRWLQGWMAGQEVERG